MCLKYRIRNTKYEIRNTKSGFTLLEVIVTLFIITLLTSLFLTNYRAGSRNTDLTFAMQKLVSDIRTAQNNSLGSVFYNATTTLGGWGVHFDIAAGNNTAYFIFADQNNNKVYDNGEAVETAGGQTITLPANIVIDRLIDSSGAGDSHFRLDITFLPPDPVTRIYWDGNSSSSKATIGLRETVQEQTKSLIVNKLGLIEINNP